MVRVLCTRTFVRGSVIYWKIGTCYEATDKNDRGWRIKNNYGSESFISNEEFDGHFKLVGKNLNELTMRKIKITSYDNETYVIEMPESIPLGATFDELESWVYSNIKNVRSWEVTE